MKIFVFLGLVLSVAAVAAASSRDLIKATPRDSFFVLSADVQDMKDNEVFSTMAKNNQIWVFDESSNMTKILADLHIDLQKDISSFLFARYMNPYGNKGKMHIFELTRDFSAEMSGKEATPYLKIKMHRLNPQQDLYAAEIYPKAWAFGSLAAVKTAIDVSKAKQEGLSKNVELKQLFDTIPDQAKFWGMSLPFSRRQAAKQGTEQSTNAMLEAFDNYRFYGIPATKHVNSHFIGKAKSDSEAAFVSTFMIGTLTFAKFKVDDTVAQMLDSVDIRREGRNIHVTGTITKEIIDSYFNGELGVD